jgi:hypothetical protein
VTATFKTNQSLEQDISSKELLVGANQLRVFSQAQKAKRLLMQAFDI